MEKTRVEAIEPISGTYGFVRPGEVIDMESGKAKELIALKLVKEFKGKIATDQVKVALDMQQPGILGAPKAKRPTQEPSKAIETDPSNATAENTTPVADPVDHSVPDGPAAATTGAKEDKTVVKTKELNKK